MPVVHADAGTSAAAPVTPESPRVSPPPGACAELLSPHGRKQQCQPAPPPQPCQQPALVPQTQKSHNPGLLHVPLFAFSFYLGPGRGNRS